MKKIIYQLIAISLVLITACQTSEEPKKAKYVFYFIGDGMGLNQTAVAEAYSGSLNNINSNSFKHLAMSKFPVVGLNYTWASNRLITGSAAGGTALASAKKTDINHINIKAEDDNYIPLSQKAYDRGMKVGIITSVQINHATPACFYAHSAHRSNHTEIASYLPQSDFDFFAGGTVAFDGAKDQELFRQMLKNKNYKWITDVQDLKQVASDEKCLLTQQNTSLNDGVSLNYAIDAQQKEQSVSLKDYLKSAISFLDNDQGFFIMAEGGKIDWACHENDLATEIHEVLAFDEAVQVALEFYKQHPEETLIVITADHETGGLTMGTKHLEYNTFLPLLAHQNVSYHFFGDSIINPYIRNNPKASFSGALQLIQQYFGLGDATKSMTNDMGVSQSLALTLEEKQALEEAYDLLKKKLNHTISEEEDQIYNQRYESYYNAVAQTAAKILANKVGISWVTFKHTATPVPVRAIGVGAEHFTGLYENTDLPKRIEQLMK